MLRLRIAAAWLGLLLGPGAVIAQDGYGHDHAAQPLVLELNPAARMVDHKGRTVTLGDFHGKPLLLYFGFTRCEGVCPPTIARIGQALELLGEDAERVQVAFVSIDATRETQDDMARFVEAIHPRLIGLTGSRKQVFDFARMFRVRFEWAPHSHAHKVEQIRHTTRLDLLSADGKLLAHMPNDLSAQELATHLLSVAAADWEHVRQD